MSYDPTFEQPGMIVDRDSALWSQIMAAISLHVPSAESKILTYSQRAHVADAVWKVLKDAP